MPLADKNAKRIYEYLQANPGKTVAQIEMALEISFTDFKEARTLLGKKIVNKLAGRTHYFYIADEVKEG